MKLIIDAMSGDHAPAEIVKGAVLAANELDASVDYLLVGREADVRRELTAAGGDTLLSAGRIAIADAPEVLTMEDDPFSVMKDKKDSSMGVALHLLADGKGDALISAGNTGALFTGASMIVRTVKGVRRAAIAALLPFETPMLLLDAGANVTVTPDNLDQFALMGSVYMKHIFGIAEPRVGLANNGAEHHKGTPVQVEAYKLLEAHKGLNFVGNVEGKEMPKSACDVLVCDGFTGNIILKLTEGLGSFFIGRMKKMFLANPLSKLSALLLKKELRKLKKDFDVSEHGGSPFLGISRPVIKAHGSSDAKAVKNACRQACNYASCGINAEIEESVRQYKLEKKAEAAEASGTEA